jgi:hypothetical protein
MARQAQPDAPDRHLPLRNLPLVGLRGDTVWDLLAVSDRLLHRDDQVDLLVFAPVDHLQCR